ncbi:MAG: aminotransferase class V-fold PLP-dependent enzyme [Chitinophagia bacterium]|nr:aminotransferase class V-fold PLP-dependent enzyme [Chitinophagia bacterium]
MSEMIYLDNNSTTPLLPEAWEAMQPYFLKSWGNPSSSYRFGAQVKSGVENARERVANLIGAEANEVLFTSSATESNNSGIEAALKASPGKRHIVTSLIEHSAVLNYCKSAEQRGYKVTYLKVGMSGAVNLDELTQVITKDTAVVTIMWANNETGVINPVEKIAEVCKEKGILFHCDAAQAVGKVKVDLSELQINYLTISAHKMYGPKGIGALFVKKGTPFEAMLIGGRQENGRRGGTENVPAIIGFGKAAEVAQAQLIERKEAVSSLRDTLESRIKKEIPSVEIYGENSERLPNTTNIGFAGIDADSMVAYLDSQGICVSSGSACLAQALAPSHVIQAMTQSNAKARAAVRFSLSHKNTEKEINEVSEKVIAGVSRLK